MLDSDETVGVSRVLAVGDFDAVELDGDFVTDASDLVSVPSVSLQSRLDLRFSKESL